MNEDSYEQYLFEHYGTHNLDIEPLRNWKPDFTKWIAIGENGLWNIAPKVFWEKNSCIPDFNLNFEIIGFEEVQEHTLLYVKGMDVDWDKEQWGDGQKEIEEKALKELGFEILENPVWYYDK